MAYTSNCINIPSTSCSPLIILIYFSLPFSHVFSLFSGRFSSIHHINGNKIDLNCFQNKETWTIYILVLHHRVNLVLVESYQYIMHCHIITLMSLLISLKICVTLRWLWRPMDLLFSDKLWPWVYIVNVNFFLSVSRMLCNKWITGVKG